MGALHKLIHLVFHRQVWHFGGLGRGYLGTLPFAHAGGNGKLCDNAVEADVYTGRKQLELDPTAPWLTLDGLFL